MEPTTLQTRVIRETTDTDRSLCAVPSCANWAHHRYGYGRVPLCDPHQERALTLEREAEAAAFAQVYRAVVASMEAGEAA